MADHAALMARLDAVVRAGGEGLMLHRDASLYQGVRSADLLKVKPYEDAEARVIGHIPGQGKYAGILGALEVVDGEGRRFRIGTGFSDAQRRDPPPLGSQVTYQFRGRTEQGSAAVCELFAGAGRALSRLTHIGRVHRSAQCRGRSPEQPPRQVQQEAPGACQLLPQE